MVQRVFYNAMRGDRHQHPASHGRDYSEFLSVRHTRLQAGLLEATAVHGESALAFLESGEVVPPKGQTSLDLERLEALIVEHDPDLAELEEAIDRAAQVLEFSATNEARVRSLQVRGPGS